MSDSLHGISRGSAPRSNFHQVGRYGRLFPELPPLRGPLDELRRAMRSIGRVDGPMFGSGPDQLGENDRIPAGFTFFGQFVDHDVTFDPTSSLERTNDPESLWNFRTPLLELDSLYGSGPDVDSYLYDQERRRAGQIGRFHVARERRHDVPRNDQDTALIADPRNDENLILAQLHGLFLRFHNLVLDEVSESLSAWEAFEEAQRIVRWHYQWIVLDEYLPLICGCEVVGELRRQGRRYYRWRNEPFMPVEFSGAVFRFGHSEVRRSYPLSNNPAIAVDPKIFSESADVFDLRGGRLIAPLHAIGWHRFFKRREQSPTSSFDIDTFLAPELFHLPGVPPPRSLAERNLLRGLSLELPSGQAVARRIGMTPLGPEHFEDLRSETPAALRLDVQTPLWFYVLREAKDSELSKGKRLGPVGARLVAEVIIGLLEGDRFSFLNVDRNWKPSFLKDGRFHMSDLIDLVEQAED